MHTDAGHILSDRLGGPTDLNDDTSGKVEALFANFFPQNPKTNRHLGKGWRHLEQCITKCLNDDHGRKATLTWKFEYDGTQSLYPQSIEYSYQFTKECWNATVLPPMFCRKTAELTHNSGGAGCVRVGNKCHFNGAQYDSCPSPPPTSPPLTWPPNPPKKQKTRRHRSLTGRRHLRTAATQFSPPPDLHPDDHVRAAFASLPPNWRARAQQEAAVGRQLSEATDDDGCIGSLEGGVRVALSFEPCAPRRRS